MTTITACTSTQPANLKTALAALTTAWQADQHAVWQLDWPNAPVGGPLTVETWQAGNRYRYEILEANTPALIGQTLVFNGQTGWQYNRLNPPKIFSPTEPALSPVTDAIAIINHLLDTPPQTATQEATAISSVPVQKIALTYQNGDTLTLWLDEELDLLLKIKFSAGQQQATLQARTNEKLIDPPPELFSVGEWVQNQ